MFPVYFYLCLYVEVESAAIFEEALEPDLGSTHKNCHPLHLGIAQIAIEPQTIWASV